MLQAKQTQDNYSFLQKRTTKKSDNSFKKLNQAFITNNYTIQINPKKCRIYQYDYEIYVDNNTKIVDDSKLYYKIIKQNKQQLIDTIGYIAHSKRQVFGYKKQPKTSLKCKIGQQDIYEAVFNQVKEIDMRDLLFSDKSSETKMQILQLLNITLKNKLKNRGFVQLGKFGKYFEKDPKINIICQYDKQPLNIMQGYKFTIVQMNRQYLLQIDTCFRILQQKRFIDQIKMKWKKVPKQKLCQQLRRQQVTVTSKYGSYRNYKVLDIDFTKNPKSTFLLSDKKEISYIDYYYKNYKLKIEDQKQPLIKVLLRTDKKIGENGKIIKQQIYGYLIPELVSLAGIKNSQSSSYKNMNQVAKHTKLKPSQKLDLYQDAKDKLNQQSQFIKIGKNVYTDGYLLERPQLQYKKGVKKPDQYGRIKQLTNLYQANQFKQNQYLFVYSYGKNPDIDDDDADNALALLQKSSSIYGIKFRDPKFLCIKYNRQPNVNQWIDRIGKQCQDRGNPSIIILFFNRHQEEFYDKLKSYLINQLKVPSQVIRRITFQDKKKAQSAASKLAIQMNVKAGCAAWKVKKNHPYFDNRNLLYAAITVSKGKNGTYLSFVGSINNDCTDFYATCKKVKNISNISLQTLQQIFKAWVKSYCKVKQNKLPDTILIYREGLNEKQAQQMISLCQVPALQYMVKGISKLFKVQNYKPECQIILVNKKINCRFFEQGKNKQQNPKSGSIITDGDDCKTFYLVPQFVNQGTCTPTSYKIILDRSNIPQEALMTFTYEQCFNYYNWEGAVRVPSALQYANKLAKLCSEHLRQQVEESSLNNLLFFL